MAAVAPQRRNKFKVPGYVKAAAVISIGGFITGYDTGTIGPITEMDYFFRTFGHLTPGMRGWAVSLIMLTGAISSTVAGHLADKYGRVRIILLGALTFVLGAALQGGAYHMPMFLVGRALCGLGMGLWIGNVSVYICEISPSARRGTLVSTPQFLCATGICIGYFTCYGTSRMENSMSWRLPFVFQALLASAMAITCFLVPDSPRWLMYHGYREQAQSSLARLDISRAEAEKDILRPTSPSDTAPSSPLEAFLTIWRKEHRRKTILALFVLGMVQLSGIDGVLYYAPTLFAQAGLPPQTSSFLASGVSAILMLLVSIPAFLLADKWGRRTSAITGGLILAGCMLLIGTLYASNSVHSNAGIARWLVIALIFVFALTYCITWAVVSKLYASEIQPNRTRGTANAVAQALNFFTNFVVALLTPPFLAASSSGAYFLFGTLALGTVGVLAVWMPETKGLSLEDVQEAFQRPVVNLGRLGSVGRRLLGMTGIGMRVPMGEQVRRERRSGESAEGERIEMSGALGAGRRSEEQRDVEFITVPEGLEGATATAVGVQASGAASSVSVAAPTESAVRETAVV